jgi:polysaccharide export outer membrane protein
MNRIFFILKNSRILIIIGVIAYLTSCTPQKKLIYLQEKAQKESSNVYSSKGPDYRLRPYDVLYIRVNSINSESFDFFNAGQGVNNSYLFQSEMGVYLNSYTITDSGFINFPVVGNIEVSGLTIEEAQKKIQSSINNYLKDATATVKLASYRVSIIGDVMKPGVYYFYQDKVNLLEAIAKAGDLTVYGNRFRVMLVRKTEKGDKVSFIDLTDRNLLNKEEFYILPNDIIYVEPNKVAKSLGFATFPWSLMLSTISTVVAVIALAKK